MTIPRPEKRGRKPRKRIKRGAPIRRSARPRAERQGEQASKRRYAAELWRWGIYRKAGMGPCMRCRQRSYYDACHFFGKGPYPHLKFDLDNGVPCCRQCHRLIDHDKRAKADLALQILGIEGYAALAVRAMRPVKVDIDATIERLRVA